MKWCRVCGVAENLNPTDDHENWTGHPWEPMEGPGPRRRLTQAEWEAELARARGVQAMDVDRLITPPGVRELSRDDWEAARRHWETQMDDDPAPLITRTPRKRSRWGRPWERKRG